MRYCLIILTTFVLAATSTAQTPIIISKVFAKEPQNRMAAKIPAKLLEAYQNGDIAAYYPENTRVRIPYAQFLKHFGFEGRAMDALNSAPVWFCSSRDLPGVPEELVSCLSKQFEIAERKQVNVVTQMPEKKQSFIRLVHDASCDPRGIDSYGPVFMIEDINAVGATQYGITNPQNDAITYSVADLLRLRLYSGR